jgi:hypothetical protein
MLGLDLQPAVDGAWYAVGCVDELMFSTTGMHVARYSDEVLEKCYNCDLPDSGDVAKVIKKLGDPATDLVNGAITFASVFTGQKPKVLPRQ